MLEALGITVATVGVAVVVLTFARGVSTVIRWFYW
jgi:hypothetical protein